MSESLHHPAWSLLLAAAVTAPLGCKTPESGEHRAYYDEPPRVPVGVPYDGEPLEATPEPVENPDECPRGRGIDSDGNCVRLASRELMLDGQQFGGMVQIPAGAFLRGDIPSRYDAGPARGRAHVQHAGQPLFQDQLPSYWIDGYEVSRGAYQVCVDAGACAPAQCLDGNDGRPTNRQLGDDDLRAFPQTCVTHEQAQTYCEWRGHRLPTEAEWEYAARGPEGWMFPWGHEFRDELGLALGPVGFDPLDVSYFGLKGFGGNATEWVADPFDPDANIEHYLTGEFRSDTGPLARAWSAWVEGLCGGSRCDLGQRYVVKGGRTGARAGAWQLAEGRTLAESPTSNFEADRAIAQNDRLGFRCAADLGDDTPVLTVPQPVTPLPLLREVGGYQLFLAIAEAVDHDEARRFCSRLAGPGDSRDPAAGDNGWRLPSLEEIDAAQAWFGGPGPFWTREGAAEQTYVDAKSAEWSAIEADESEPLMARCLRPI